LPPHICPKRWDTVFYSPDEKIVYRLPEYAHLFTPRRIALMDEAIRRSNLLLADLYSSGRAPHLIHGDLNYGNVHVHRDRLYLLDFEDIMLGYTPARTSPSPCITAVTGTITLS